MRTVLYCGRTKCIEHVHVMDAIDRKLLRTIVKFTLNDSEMELMRQRVPASFGGIAFDDPVVDSGHKYADSIECTANLSQQIMDNGNDLMQNIELDSKRKTVRQRHEAVLKMMADALQRRLRI